VIDTVARHVALFNEGVRTGDFAPWFNTFTDDAVLTVNGSRANGRSEIEALYRAQSPASEMSLTAGSPADRDAETVFGEFFWVREPDKGGRFTLHLVEGRASHVEIELDAPPPLRPQVPDGVD